MGSPLNSVVLNDAEYGMEKAGPVVYARLSGKPVEFYWKE